jgi:hypothetical protein
MKGWHNDNYRHSLAARGYRISMKRPDISILQPKIVLGGEVINVPGRPRGSQHITWDSPDLQNGSALRRAAKAKFWADNIESSTMDGPTADYYNNLAFRNMMSDADINEEDRLVEIGDAENIWGEKIKDAVAREEMEREINEKLLLNAEKQALYNIILESGDAGRIAYKRWLDDKTVFTKDQLLKKYGTVGFYALSQVDERGL